jgi:uncharacterized protein with GYD domain
MVSNSREGGRRLGARAGSKAPGPRHAVLSFIEGGAVMATFITLGNFTDQGVKSIKDSVKRSDAVKELAKKFGVTVKEIYWTMGAYDIIGVFEAPNGESMSAMSLAIGMAGNLRGQTLRAFGKEEFSGILKKLD